MSKYKELLEERIWSGYHSCPFSEVKIGLPNEFSGAEYDLIIVGSLRPSVSQGLGALSEVTALQLALTRSTKATWLVGSLQALAPEEETNARLRDENNSNRIFKKLTSLLAVSGFSR